MYPLSSHISPRVKKLHAFELFAGTNTHFRLFAGTFYLSFFHKIVTFACGKLCQAKSRLYFLQQVLNANKIQKQPGC
jgi:hypothetical protein